MARVVPEGMECRSFPHAEFPNLWVRNWLIFRSARNSDYLLIDFDLRDVCILGMLFALFGKKRCRFFTLDFFTGKPSGTMRRMTSWALQYVDRLLVYFRDSRPYEASLGVPADRFQFVPFKINGDEKIDKLSPHEGGYIFCGGRSRRDFRTLFEAVRDLPIPVKVVTSTEAEMLPHGSTMSGLEPPSNVEIILRDSDQAFFLECMAGATLVVLPLVKGTMVQAGIGVYIQAMALRKCVVISSGIGVSDVLTDQAAIVPPGDPDILRETIVSLWNDESLRRQYAERGYAWARPLGGEDAFYRRLMAEIMRR